LVSRYICAESFLHRANGHGQSLLVRVAFYFYPTYQENAVHTSIQILVVLGLICLWRIRAELIRAVLEGVAFSLRGSVGGNQRDNSRSSTLGNRWRSALQRVVT